MDQDPIKQLQSFLDERGGVLEKITNIRSTLGSMRSEPLTTLTLQSAPNVSIDAAATEIGAHYRRLLQALYEMQAQIEQRVMPAAQLVVQNQIDQLRAQSDEKMAALRACLERIDQGVVQCLAGLDEYQTCYADLDTLNKNLTGLVPRLSHFPLRFQ